MAAATPRSALQQRVRQRPLLQAASLEGPLPRPAIQPARRITFATVCASHFPPRAVAIVGRLREALAPDGRLGGGPLMIVPLNVMQWAMPRPRKPRWPAWQHGESPRAGSDFSTAALLAVFAAAVPRGPDVLIGHSLGRRRSPQQRRRGECRCETRCAFRAADPVAFAHAGLHFNGAANRIDHAAKLHEGTVAGSFGYAAMVESDG